jgi:hypothetical protein
VLVLPSVPVTARMGLGHTRRRCDQGRCGDQARENRIARTLDEFHTEIGQHPSLRVVDRIVHGEAIDVASEQGSHCRQSGHRDPVHQYSVGHGRRFPA